jgi:hypothetical protein
MALYRLLRSNKESGPYSLNDLLALGLKPYDLVWVEGRSAAWRYPSEVSELKEFAPAVEEQPFDRFFKKPTGKETETTPSNQFNRNEETHQKTVNENFVNAEPVQKNKEEELPNIKKNITEIPNNSPQPQPKKQVFVSMPETIGFTSYPNPNPHHEEKYDAYLPKSKSVKETPPIKERSYSPINIQESEESKLETKYTQSLDDIKEMYINTLVQRKTKNRKKEIINRYLKPALLPLLLVVTGIAIGYFIWNRKTSLQASQTVSKVIPPQTTPDQKNEVIPADQNDQQPGEKQNSVSLNDNKNKKPILVPEENGQQQKTAISREHKQLRKAGQSQKESDNSLSDLKSIDQSSQEKQTYTSTNQNQTFQKKDVEVDAATGERRKVTRDDDLSSDNSNTVKNDPGRSNKKSGSAYTFLDNNPKNLLNKVSVKSNTYIRGAFGGIRGLELTVFNNSSYLLDEVKVELQIMKPSDQPLRTDIITFHNIGANGAVTVKVPDSQRGIRVEYRITDIESRQWQKTTAGL